MGSNYNTTSSRNYITEENIPRIDPTFPTSIGGLLAEEWTINPNSALPSFLEMTMIDEARKSGCQTIQWILQHIEHTLFQIASSSSSSSAAAAEATTDNNHNNNNNNIRSSSRSSWFRRYRSKFFMFIVNNILKPYKPEIRFVIMYLIEKKSLLSISSSATISESLYGGKRCKLIEAPKVPPPGGGEIVNNSSKQQQQQQKHGQYRLSPMSKQDGIRLAFLLALGPYLQERCSIIYENLTSRPNPNGRISISSLRIKKIIKVVFPFLHMTIQGIHLLYRWKFLMGKSFYFDGYSRYLNLIVRRITMADHHHQQQQQQQRQHQQQSKKGQTVASSNLSSSSSSSLSETAAAKIPDQDDDTVVYNMYADTMKNILKSKKLRQIAIGILSSTVVLGWIARIRASRYEIINNRRRERLLQQQQQQQQSNNNNNNNNAIDDSFPPYPPPPIPTIAREGVDRSLANVSSKLCPLCRRPRVNPTAATSGYVFCLKCLLAYISKNPICPVTGKACPENSIVQLFEPNL